MRTFSLVAFSVDRPKTVVWLSFLLGLAFLTQFPRMTTDTNPKNMLPATSAVRVGNDAVEKTFGLYEDMIVLGVSHDQGVVNPETLARIKHLTEEIVRIGGVAARDVASFTTIDNVTAGDGALRVAPLMTEVPVEKIERASANEDTRTSRTARWLVRLSRIGSCRPRATILVGAVLLVAAVAGVSRIHVNNNMVEWFKADSEIRQADRVLNQALGGTSLAYVVAVAQEDNFMKRPEAMRYIEGLQRHLETLPQVGKTFSVADYVKRINLVLHDNDPKFDTVPETQEEIGQYLFLFGMSAKPSDLDNVVDYPFRQANIWVLKTWDAQAMRQAIAAMDDYARNHPLAVELQPAGIAYFNLVWNDEVLWDMLKGFLSALVMVFVILIANFRSFKWAALSYVPLLFTILLLYGVIGFAGKNFDMPISVLSCLSLGMAVDFAIHFVGRLRLRRAEAGTGESLVDSLAWTAARPGKGIMRNALLFASAFSVMLFAPLTPYITVGAFIVSMMVLSAFLTIVYLSALVTVLRGPLFQGE